MDSTKIVDSIILFLLFVSFLFIAFNNPVFTGFASKQIDDYTINETSLIKIQKLKLASMCSYEPEIYRAWRVWNKNSIDLEFNWDVYGTNQNGSGIAIADGYFYFNTTTVEGDNAVRIFLNNSQHDVKASSEEKCNILCIENWTCMNWSECIEENQTRECFDINNCNTTVNIPLLLQECEIEEPELCIENWTCMNWTQCINLTQERVCSDANNCNTSLEIPVLLQNCNYTETNQTESESNETQEPETQEETLITESSGSSGGGAGNRAYKNEATPNITTKSETNQPSEGKEIISEVNKNEVNQEELEKEMSFVRFAGNSIRFFEEKGIDYRAGIFAVSLLAVIAISLVTKHFVQKRKLEKMKSEKLKF